MLHAIAGALILAAVSTLGDFLWEALSLRHRVAYGLAHGGAVCLSVGAIVGWRTHRVAIGALAGVAIGVAAAGLFYVLAPALHYSAMFPAWMFFWNCFAILQVQLDGSRDYRSAMVRGLIAAILSGFAFYAISGIWTHPSPGGPNYVRNFFSWAVAFFPVFAALFADYRGVRVTRREAHGSTPDC